MNKLCIIFLVVALIVVVSAIGGVKDVAGNYYDLTTGQLSSSTTGKVYNPVYAYDTHVQYSPYPYYAPYGFYGPSAYYSYYPGAYYLKQMENFKF